MNKETFQDASGNFLKTIGIIHWALCLGVILFMVFAYIGTDSTSMSLSLYRSPYVLLLPILGLSGIFLGNFLFNQQLKSIDKQKSLGNKLGPYQSASLIRWALIEGPALLCIIAFMDKGQLEFLIISGMLLAYMVFLRPSRSRISKELKIAKY